MNQTHDRTKSDFRPLVTRSIVYLSVVMYLLTSWMRKSGVTWIDAGYGLVPSRLTADPTGEAYKVVTSLFLHASFSQLLWNLLFLFVFGRRVEKAFGGTRYALFFVLAGVAGAMGQQWIDPDSTLPLIGASGAVAGILGAYLVLHAQAPFTFFRVPAWLILGSWFAGTLIGGLNSVRSGEAEPIFFANLGGFLAGLLLARTLSLLESEKKEGNSRRYLPRRKIFPKDDDGPFWQR